MSCGRCCDIVFGGVYGMASRLTAAFGWQFVVSFTSIGAASTGIGQQLLDRGLEYYALDTLSLASEEWNRYKSLIKLPWQIKPIIGFVSDVQLLPCGRLRRTPYLIAGAILGMVSSGTLFGAVGMDVEPTINVILLLGLALKLGAAAADVMMDAIVAEKAGERPDLTADMQGLSMTSVALCYVIIPVLAGKMIQSSGVQPLFKGSFLAFLWVLVPPLCRWVEKERAADGDDTTNGGGSGGSGGSGGGGGGGGVTNADHRKRAGQAAVVVSTWATLMGAMNLAYGHQYALELGAVSELSNIALCGLLYVLLRPLDERIPRAAIFCYLFNALWPASTIMFEWQHAPGKSAEGDLRCYSEEQCADALATGVVDANGLRCGWAREIDAPCLSPSTLAALDGLQALFFVLATGLYTSLLQGIEYRTMFYTTLFTRGVASALDYLLVMRINLALGIPDFWFMLITKILAATNFRLMMMPLFTLLTQLCPPGLEGTIFALLMGLENFGEASGHYLGSQVLNILGGVRKPDFEHLEKVPLVAAAFSFACLALVPGLIPHGRPSDSLRMPGSQAAGNDKQKLNLI